MKHPPSRSHFPVEALSEIFAFLPRDSIDRLSLTNRLFYKVSTLPRFTKGPLRQMHRLEICERSIRLVPYKRRDERGRRQMLRNDGPGGEQGYLIPFLDLPRWLVMIRIDVVDCDLKYFGKF